MPVVMFPSLSVLASQRVTTDPRHLAAGLTGGRPTHVLRAMIRRLAGRMVVRNGPHRWLPGDRISGPGQHVGVRLG